MRRRGCAMVGIAAAATVVGGRAYAASGPAVAEAAGIGDAFADVADEVAPSVVRIVVAQRESTANPAAPSQAPGASRGIVVNGSGLVVDEQGDIVTDGSLIAGASSVSVELPDGKTAGAIVLGTDPSDGLAVVRVPGARLRPARFGDARRMRTGQWLLAIGRAGNEHTVSVGVLTAKENPHLIGTRVEPYLETDASIDPASIGGALVNLDGEVVGLCQFARERGTMGIAVPSWRVRKSVETIRRGARASR